MKILIANWVYNWGSTGYIIRDLRREFELQGHTVLIAAGKSYGSDDVMEFCTPFENKFFGVFIIWALPDYGGAQKLRNVLFVT